MFSFYTLQPMVGWRHMVHIYSWPRDERIRTPNYFNKLKDWPRKLQMTSYREKIKVLGLESILKYQSKDEGGRVRGLCLFLWKSIVGDLYSALEDGVTKCKLKWLYTTVGRIIHLRKWEWPSVPLCAGSKPLPILPCNYHLLNGTITNIYIVFQGWQGLLICPLVGLSF